MMDEADRARWDAMDRAWWKRHLDEKEREEWRRQWRERHRWLIRSGIAVAVASWVAVSAGIGWMLGAAASRPRTVEVHIIQGGANGR